MTSRKKGIDHGQYDTPINTLDNSWTIPINARHTLNGYFCVVKNFKTQCSKRMFGFWRTNAPEHLNKLDIFG